MSQDRWMQNERNRSKAKTEIWRDESKHGETNGNSITKRSFRHGIMSAGWSEYDITTEAALAVNTINSSTDDDSEKTVEKNARASHADNRKQHQPIRQHASHAHNRQQHPGFAVECERVTESTT